MFRNRLQIEIFFKWIKQNLTIKKLWGPICTYLIVATSSANPEVLYQFMR
ncbi:MAG: hypothetical protein Q8S18_12650 [Bacteroidales bacterium]|nr:hypothetical protein [Bacteroidales bacterium]